MAGKPSRRVEEDGVEDAGDRIADSAVDRVGRFPGDYRKCVTGAGEVICVVF